MNNLKQQPTKVNHFIPCFWSAYWNTEFLTNKRKGNKTSKRPRDIQIYCLNLRAKRILSDKTRNIFKDKDAGIAYINTELEYDVLKEKSNNEIPFEFEEHALLLDFENHFTEFENIVKTSVEDSIINKRINSMEDKTYIAMFIYLQGFRSYKNFEKVNKMYFDQGKSKLELFIDLKDAFTNKEKLASILLPLVYCKWKLYLTESQQFPLTDQSVLLKKNHIFFPLAPDILIEIQLNRKTEEICVYSQRISWLRYRRFKNRTYQQCSREVIFGTKEILEEWEHKFLNRG